MTNVAFRGNPLVPIITFGGIYGVNPFPGVPNFMFSGNPLERIIVFTGVYGEPGGKYLLLYPHQINDTVIPAGTIISEGVEVPFNWVPTLAVDPLDERAARLFYAAGPRDVASASSNDLNEFGVMPTQYRPTTFWKQVPGTGTWALTGLGSTYTPRGP